MITTIHQCLTTANSTDPANTSFGGVNIIFIGDFSQLPPIGDRPLWTSNPKGIMNIIGRMLWLRLTDAIILQQQMRQNDQAYLNILRHLRTGSCTREVYETLRTRIVGKDSLSTNPWNNAPIIVSRNQLRMHLNIEAAFKLAADTQSKVLLILAKDSKGKGK